MYYTRELQPLGAAVAASSRRNTHVLSANLILCIREPNSCAHLEQIAAEPQQQRDDEGGVQLVHGRRGRARVAARALGPPGVAADRGESLGGWVGRGASLAQAARSPSSGGASLQRRRRAAARAWRPGAQQRSYTRCPSPCRSWLLRAAAGRKAALKRACARRAAAAVCCSTAAAPLAPATWAGPAEAPAAVGGLGVGAACLGAAHGLLQESDRQWLRAEAQMGRGRLQQG